MGNPTLTIRAHTSEAYREVAAWLHHAGWVDALKGVDAETERDWQDGIPLAVVAQPRRYLRHPADRNHPAHGIVI